MAVGAARDDHVERQRAGEHGPDLHRRGLRPQHQAGLAPGSLGVLDEDRVLRVSSRVVRQHVQRIEVVPLRLDLGSLGDFVAHGDEHVGQPVGEGGDGMARARRNLIPGQGHVDRLGDQHLPVSFGLQLGLPRAQRLAELAAGRADPPTRLSAGLGRQRADLRAGQRQRRPVTLVGDPRRLQLVEGPGGGDGSESLVEDTGHLVRRQRRRRLGVVILVRCGHGSCFLRAVPLAGV